MSQHQSVIDQLTDEDKTLLIEKTDLLKWYIENVYTPEWVSPFLASIDNDALDQFLTNSDFLSRVLLALKETLNVNEIEAILLKNLDVASMIEDPSEDLSQILKSCGLNHESYDLIEELKKRYHKHDSDVKHFINDLSSDPKLTLLLRS